MHYYSSYFTHQDLKDSVIQSVDAVKTVKQSIFSLVTSIPKVTWIQEVFLHLSIILTGESANLPSHNQG